jgi:4'-phosphopantetheinyl transferase
MTGRYDGWMLLPPDGEAHVWWADLGLVDAAWLSLLDPGEIARYQQYRRDDDRGRFLLGTAMVRHLFAAESGLSPAAVRLDRSCPDCDRPHGKVRLAADPEASAPRLEVSVSHSGRWVVLAVCRAYPVGVDVERLDRGLDHRQVARLALTDAEVQQLQGVPDAERAAAFTRLWVRKEAVVKATGDGLRTPLATFAVSPADAAPRLVAWPSRPDLLGRIQLHDLACDGGHRAALAVVDAEPVEVHNRNARDLLDG